MRRRVFLELIDDPRAVTLAVVILLAAGLWTATWSTMGRMDMAGMDMAGMGMAGMGVPGAEMGGMTMGGAEATGAGMEGMAASRMGGMTSWSVRLVAESAAMWVLMMAAMMAPAMAPVIALYAGVASREDRGARLAARILLFAVGYFALWGVFSVAAAVLQLALRDSAYFTMGGTQAGPIAAGALMMLAGAYQLTPLKAFCLRHCRHPLAFLLSHWREGLGGAFPVGLRHGLYCLGCCVALMGLMFVFGAMNVWWMAVIAAYFLAEKIAPHAETWSVAAGVALLMGGAGLAGASALGVAVW